MIQDSLVSIERPSSNLVGGMNDPICQISRIALVREIRVLGCHIGRRKMMELALSYDLTMLGLEVLGMFQRQCSLQSRELEI